MGCDRVIVDGLGRLKFTVSPDAALLMAQGRVMADDAVVTPAQFWLTLVLFTVHVAAGEPVAKNAAKAR